MSIYLDYCAGTYVDPRVKKAIHAVATSLAVTPPAEEM